MLTLAKHRQWPTGITVSKNGRKFSCFPSGLDPTNTYNGLVPTFQVAELTGTSSETAYPNATYNMSPGGAVDPLNPTLTKGDPNHLLGVQSVVIDETNILWILDTGRVISLTDPARPMLKSQPGGPKLVAVDLATNQVIQTITFPSNVVYPESYLNDVRFDRRSNLSGISGGRGVAYITDSSVEGRNGLVIVDIGTGKSWRHLDNSPTVHAINGTVPFVYGAPMYQLVGVMKPTDITFGADGIALSPDGATLYYSVIGGRFLYSVPTALLRAQGGNSDAAAVAAIQNLGEKGISDGLETDTTGIVYAGNAEQNAISMYDKSTGYATVFVRDPRINWVDTQAVGFDGYLYFTVNQLNDLFAIYPGTGLPLVDRRTRPFVCFRVKLPNGGSKINPGTTLL